MSNAPNDLTEDFPGRADRIHQLKTTNNRFSRLYDEYNDLNRTIHRIETRVEPQSEEAEEELKRRRLQIKDEIMAMLDNESA
ncbi:YdcH family protein [Microvirga sp. M2]|uniref:YdcH family protein n=1 Tax=Microvirga sp. M2 TaxID=3073270 RepID=UPI0039C3B4D0